MPRRNSSAHTHGHPSPDEVIRFSFVSMFRAAPVGASILLEQTPNWCTSVAAQAHRKIKTEKCIAHGKRGGNSVEMTRIVFLGEKPQKPITLLSDPRQILLPGLVGEPH